MFLDNVQFEKGSYTSRNKIKTPQGCQWLTVPVITKGHMNAKIKDLCINNISWKRKHLSSIGYSYRKAPDFERKYALLEQLYHSEYELFADMCYDHLLFWLRQSGIKTSVVRSIDLSIDCKGGGSKVVHDICSYLGADFYISGPQGVRYINEESFRKSKIKIVYHDFKHPVYPQLWGDFVPNMGVIDWWMNVS